LSTNYSIFAFSELKEGNLDEKVPMTNDPKWANWGSSYFCPNDKKHSKRIPSIYAIIIDWNCDGMFTSGVESDVNGDGNTNDLHSQVDWTSIHFTYSPPAGQNTGSRPTGELTVSGANRIPLPPVNGLTALAHGNSVRLSWNAVRSSRVRGYEVQRIATGQPAVVFVTSELSYVDNLPQPTPQVKYNVHTLFTPHGASDLIRLTGKKIEGFDQLEVGKTKTLIAARLADKPAVVQLQRNLTAAIQTLRSLGGMTPSSIQGLARKETDELKTLLASQPATIEVKFH
jgi:hypothetical protein